jgi:hypothetical protein
MVEEFTTLPDKPDGGSAGPTGLEHETLTRRAAGVARDHKFGIGLGILGLLIGGAFGSPLLAVIGFLGGLGAGSALLDGHKEPPTAVGQELSAAPMRRSNSIPSEMPILDGLEPAARAIQRAQSDIGPDTAAADVRFDSAFGDSDSSIRPVPTGKPRKRNIELG